MRPKAQSIMEYVALLAIVSVALATMQLYFKQGIQAGIRGFADYIGSQKKGSAEDDYQYKWFTDGEKGFKGRSHVDSQENRDDATIFDSNSVVYNQNDTVGQSSSKEGQEAYWSVGIERERAKGEGDN